MEQRIKQHTKIGSFIRNSRKRKKLTQEQLAAKLQILGMDMTRGTLAKIEAGIRHISFDELKLLKQALDIDLNKMFEE